MQLQATKKNNDKLAALWMCGGSNLGSPTPKIACNNRPVMLIPANTNSMPRLQPTPQPRLLMSAAQPSPILTAPYAALAACPGLNMPYIRTNSVPLIYAPPSSIPGSIPGTFRTGKCYLSTNGRRKRRPAQIICTHKSDSKRKQRRKSVADVVDGNPKFQYTGLDRVIADNFLARQERTQAMSGGNPADYTSSSGGSETYGGVQTLPSRIPTKSKIVCQDVVM